MRKFLRLLHIALTLCLLAGVATFILRAAISLQTNGEIDYGEGIVMWQAANVTDWTRAFAVCNYEQAVEPFLKTDRLTESERAMLMGGACAKAYGWSPKKRQAR